MAPVYVTGYAAGYYFNDTFLTSVGVDISLDSVSDLIASLKLSPSNYAFVVDQNAYGVIMDASVLGLIFGEKAGITDNPITVQNQYTNWTNIFNKVIAASSVPGATGYFEVDNVEFPLLNKSHVTYKGSGAVQTAYVFYYALELDATQWYAISLVPKSELENAALTVGVTEQRLSFDRTVIDKGYQYVYYNLSYVGYIAVAISPDVISTSASTLVNFEIDGIRQDNKSSYVVYPGQSIGLTYALNVIEAKSGKLTMQLLVNDDNYITCSMVDIISLSVDVSINDQVVKTVTMNPVVVYSLYALGSLAGAIILFFCWILFRFRGSRLLKASQQPMLYVIMLGEVLGVGKILIAASVINTNTCIAGLWAAHLGFFMVFTSLLLKSWRINKLLNNRSIKKVKITNSDIMVILFSILFLVCILLILLTVIGQPHLAYITETGSTQITKYPYCAYEYSQFQITFYVIEILLLFYGVKLCWDIKGIPDAINESQYVVAAMASIALLSYMCFPIIISQPPWVNQMIASYGFVVGVIGTTLLVFLPKASILLSGKDLNKDMTIGDTQSNGSAKVFPSSLDQSNMNTDSDVLDCQSEKSLIKTDPLARGTKVSTDHSKEPTLKDVKGRNSDEQLEFINNKMNEWNKLKIKLEQKVLLDGRTKLSDQGRSSSSFGSSIGSIHH